MMLRSLWRATANATKQAFAWNIEEFRPPKEKILFNFSVQEEIRKWNVYSDSELGGSSSAAWELSGDKDPVGIFSGDLSLKITDPRVLKRGGFTGIRTIAAAGKLDLEPFDTISMRLKGDGRRYVTTIRTECWVGGPVGPDYYTWQALMYAPKDTWYEVRIPFEQFLPTWQGKVTPSHGDMNPARVIGLAISATAGDGLSETEGGPGRFRLELDCIKALRCSENSGT